MAQAPSSAASIRWDLSDLFSGPEDPAIEATLAEAKRNAEAFVNQFRGTIHVPGGPTPEHLLAGIQQLEAISERISRVGSYSGLLYAADTSKPVHRDLQQKVEQRVTELRNLLLFFDLEWLELSDADANRLIDHPTLATYRNYLRNERRYRPHMLSEAEEKIVNEKDVTGGRAWQRLFTELTSSLTFPVQQNGETRELTLSETLALFHNPDRTVRQAAHDGLYDVLASNGQVLTFTYDTLIQDHLTMDRLRKYPDPMLSRHLSNEIDPESVKNMMEVVEANYGIAHDYFTLKAQLVGLPKLRIYDQYAPVGAAGQYTYAQAKDSILEALNGFTPSFAGIAREFFDKNWIDAELRPGKRGGAFCASPTPQLHPYILCNYTDNMRDAMTVAHELGHGIHGYLSRGQTLFNYHPSLPVAETASVFAEILVFDRLAQRQPDGKAQLALVCQKIEDIFATVFRQNVLTRFEQKVFNARPDGRLTPEKFGDLWIEANAPYYGDALEMTTGYRWGWSYIPHFINTRFYCYSYVFGELLVLALYGMYRQQGESFVPAYEQLLERGGSTVPEELLRPLGVDIRDPNFWQIGFGELSRMVNWAKELAQNELVQNG